MQIVWYTDSRHVKGQGYEFVKHVYHNTPETFPEWEYTKRRYTGAEHRCDETTGEPWSEEYMGTVSPIDVMRKVIDGCKAQ